MDIFSFSTLAMGRDNSIAIESIVLPKKTVVCDGGVTFFQDTLKPSKVLIDVTMLRAAKESWAESATTRKSSK